ncbi:MAG: hypothetical protein LBI40_03365, partial [Treponema sp.]|nr:hypothetical protein [Treponema sp.]
PPYLFTRQAAVFPLFKNGCSTRSLECKNKHSLTRTADTLLNNTRCEALNSLWLLSARRKVIVIRLLKNVITLAIKVLIWTCFSLGK